MANTTNKRKLSMSRYHVYGVKGRQYLAVASGSAVVAFALVNPEP